MTAGRVSSDDTPTGRSAPTGMVGGAPAGPAAPIDEPTTLISRPDDPTALIAAVSRPPPVFVDPSGRRRSRLRWLAYAAGLLGLIYTGLVAVSFAGGMVEPHTVLPFVDEAEQPERSQSPQTEAITTVPEPSTAVPRTPAATMAPTVVPATPRSVAPTRSPSATRSPSGSPASAPTPPRPTPTVSVAPTPAVSPSTEDPPPPPAAPDDLPDEADPADG
ncbi:hypothetical protein [Micromonospora sp. LH3U1]|uniref:hypothetical protein n=1 Tax=Micromonospora sp. LH3U1 TaxID=3018339 RepID=UPI00234A59F3|nr:hypothetical protein [Micromonospora sp. LH3U1]WCN80619.1 hypothetical protein PCA76_27525 [Micromonospora sp. LH3U1]